MSKEAPENRIIYRDDWVGCYDSGWRGLIVPESFSHPAKFSYKLTERMIGHAYAKGWVKKGSVVVDPFGGVGCGGIVAAYNDLVWIGCELEARFVDLAKQNFELHRRKWEKLGCPQPVIVQGDSRKLCDVLESADIVVSSPPYAEAGELRRNRENESYWQKRDPKYKTSGRAACQKGYGTTPGQLGAMKPGNVDMVVSSPPYATGSIAKNSSGIDRRKQWETYRASGGGSSYEAFVAVQEKHSEEYGQTPGNLGNLKAGDVDCVVSSPPYEGIRQDGGDTTGKYGGLESYSGEPRNYWHTQRDQKNLGNNIGPTFWQAAREIVRQCHQILKPGGHAIWVVKAFVRKGEIVDFIGDWERLCESVGFVTVCRHRAMLVKETTHSGLFEPITEKKEWKSFFRRLAESKGSPRIDFEMVLCMRRKY